MNTHPEKQKKHPARHSGRDLRALFASAGAQLPIDGTRRARTLHLLRHTCQSQAVRPLPDKKVLLIHLIRYTDRNLAGVHLLSCMAMLLLLFTVGILDIPEETRNRCMMLISMLLPCFLTLFSALAFRKICFTGMAELHGTCFFHVSQLAALSLLTSGILNLSAVSAAILLVSFRWKVRLIQIGLYVLVPFILTQCVCFGCMLAEPVRRHAWLASAFLLPLSLLCLAVSQRQTWYTESALFLWAAALFAGIAVLAAETKLLFHKLNKGDLLCTTWN